MQSEGCGLSPDTKIIRLLKRCIIPLLFSIAIEKPVSSSEVIRFFILPIISSLVINRKSGNSLYWFDPTYTVKYVLSE